MNLDANNNGGATGGNRKYPNETGYVADQGIDYFDREEFRDAPDDMIARYNHRHSALATGDFTAYAYAMMTPVDELIKIMRQVDWVEGSRYGNVGRCVPQQATRTYYG